ASPEGGIAMTAFMFRSWLLGLLALSWTALLAALALLGLNDRFIDGAATGWLVFFLLPLAASVPLFVLAAITGLLSPRSPETGGARFLGVFTALLAAPIGGAFLYLQAVRLFAGSRGLVLAVAGTGALLLLFGGHQLGRIIARLLLTRGSPRTAALVLPLAALLLLPPVGSWISHRPIAFDDEPRMLVLGVDAATWKIIDPLAAEGRLPAFESLQEEGARFDLESIPPLMSPILWTTIGSGVPLWEHGVESFFSAASDVRAPRLWDIAEEKGWTVGLLGWPVTWPPRPVPGFLIPSLFARGPETFPEELQFIRELAMLEKGGRKRSLGKYAEFSVRMVQYGVKLSTFRYAIEVLAGGMDFTEKTVALRHLKLRIHSDLFVELWERYKPRFAAFYDNTVDVTCHYCWKYYEPEGFPDVTPEQAARYGDLIPRMYEATDRAIAKILECAPDNLSVLVVSDHGQEATETEESGAVRLVRTENFLKVLGLDESIDGVNLASTVHLRPKRGQTLPEGLDAYIRDVVVERTGEPVFAVNIDETGNFIVRVLPVEEIASERLLVPGRGECAASEIVEETFAKISGEHSLDAILLLKGPNVRRGVRGGDAVLYDVAPTALYQMGLPVGEGMAGRVLTSAFEEEHLAASPPVMETYILTSPVPEEGGGPDDAMLREQLRALGYLN
ncbi:MAG: alkaline phosphatase family protein, partial [Candidatus Eisenbacteria bacterium]